MFDLAGQRNGHYPRNNHKETHNLMKRQKKSQDKRADLRTAKIVIFTA